MGVVYSFAISYFLSFILSLYLLSKIYLASIIQKTKAVFEVRDLLVYSIPLMFVSILNYLLSWTDILMLGHFVSAKDDKTCSKDAKGYAPEEIMAETQDPFNGHAQC